MARCSLKKIYVERGSDYDGDEIKTYYRVTKVVNSIDYAPGDRLDLIRISDLCESRGWVVIIT